MSIKNCSLGKKALIYNTRFLISFYYRYILGIIFFMDFWNSNSDEIRYLNEEKQF